MNTESSSYKKYKQFFEKNQNNQDDSFFYSLKDFLDFHALETLGPNVITELSFRESKFDSDGFMETLGQNRQRINKITANYLYHRWIRLILIKKYSKDEFDKIKSIPLVYLPQVKEGPKAILTTQGSLVCFSQWYNDLLSGTFQTIVKASKFSSTKTKTPQISYEEAADRIIMGAKFFINDFEGELPSSLNLEPSHIYLSDLINNYLQMFILSHEYNHILLGHLNNYHKYEISPSEKLQIEIDADIKAATILKLPNNSNENIQQNSLLLSSIISHYLVTDLCNKIIYRRSKPSNTSEERFSKIIDFFTNDLKEIHTIPEIKIFDIALEKV